MRSSQYDIFVWCSDFEDFRGEGILARIFLEKISFNSNKKFFVKTPGNEYLFYNHNMIYHGPLCYSKLFYVISYFYDMVLYYTVY